MKTHFATLEHSMRALLGILLFVISPTVFGDQPPANEYETWLVPVSEAGRPGAYGAIWATTVWLTVDGPGDSALQMGPFGNCQFLCGELNSVTPTPSIPAALITSRIEDPPGVLFFVERTGAPRITMKVRVQDLARTSPKRVGVEIPVVREASMRVGGHITLLNIPGDPQFRQWLRVYDVDRHPASVFRIRGLRQITGEVVFDTTVTTIVPPFYFVPGAASLDLRPLLPTDDTNGYYLEIEPLAGDVRYWAFATVTSNETQEIVTVTP